ncbi:CLUMA_CG010651, isoform A [Clunio marinus]|uniref:CLUMA_CG010651, isoform A n=1 Tax=Clunio marinus TaxID=568069 RepID=A0A1J1IAE1_9DIPT|nr:CLUMA_CG010651, isoform A [Clunio marinus]
MPKCKENITAKKRPGVSCVSCKKVYHHNCASLSTECIKHISTDQLSWSCKKCNNPSRRSSVFPSGAITDSSSSSSSSPTTNNTIERLIKEFEDFKILTDNRIKALEDLLTEKDKQLSTLASSVHKNESKTSELDKVLSEDKLEIQGIPEASLDNPIEAFNSVASAIESPTRASEVDCFISSCGTKPTLRIKFHQTQTRSSFLSAGGVCIAVIKSQAYAVIHQIEWQTKEVEDLWITIKPHRMNEKTLHINIVYIPGETHNNHFETFTKQITNKKLENPDDNFLILGDYNVPSMYSNNTLCTSTKASMLQEFMDLTNLEQFNFIRGKHSSNNILDLVFSDLPVKVEECDEPLSRTDIFHPPIVGTLSLKLPKAAKKVSSYRNYKRVNWNDLNNDLRVINWPHAFAGFVNVDELVDRFYKTLFDILDKHCPEVKSKAKNNPSWLSKNTVKLIKFKRRFHSKWKRSNNITDYNEYSKYRKMAKEEASKDFKVFNQEAEQNIKENPKAFWKFVNEKKTNGAGVAEYLKLDDKVAYNKQDAANLFASHFSSVYEMDDDPSDPHERPCDENDANHDAHFVIISNLIDNSQQEATKFSELQQAKQTSESFPFSIDSWQDTIKSSMTSIS